MAANPHRFPRLVALAALLFYALTLSWGITLNSLPLAAKVAGWDWQPMVAEPLTWLLTLPLRCLPAGWIPVSLNLLSAAGGALTLGLLARSIELLPWNCPSDVNKRWFRFLPVVLGCVVCGLEFNFWREATASTGAMLNQLLLAAAIWCLFEYRVDKNARWLNAAAVIWGLGMAQDWGMLLNLPFFIAAVFWLDRRRFFNWRFLLRLALLGLAGFSVYALLPLVNGLNPHSPWTFGEAWWISLKLTRNSILMLYNQIWTSPRLMTGMVGLCFLVPILLLLVRLPDKGFENISKVERLQFWIFRTLIVGLLLMCLWLVFEPDLGPQSTIANQSGISLPLLSFDYLNALAIAFLSGKLLFVSQIRPTRRGRGFSWLLNVWARRAAPAGLIVLSAILFLGLMVRGAPAIFSAKHQPLESFGALAAASLPAGGGLVLSEDATKLAVFQAALAHQRDRRGVQVVDLYLLPYPEYRAALEHQQSRGWLTPPTAHALNSSELLGLLVKMAGTNRIFFLQPSPGHYFFEHFYPEPHAALTELKPYSGDQVRPPPLAPAALAAGEEFWDEAWAKQLQPVSQGGARLAGSKTMEAIFRRVLLSPLPDRQHVLLGWWYSYSLTSWGVELQRGGRLSAAQKRFEHALALSPRNWSAAMDLQCNTNLQAGKTLDLAGMTAAADQLGDFKNFARVMCRCGPFDDPGLCFLFGHACQQFGWPRQALHQLERANALAPAALPTALALAEFYSRYRMADPVFEIIQRVRANRFTSTHQLADVELELSLLEAKAWVFKTNLPNARRILQSILQQRPNDTPAVNLVFQTYQAIGDLTNALTVVTAQLALAPDNPATLNNQAAILIQLNRAGEAVSILNHALAITNSPAIRLNRAIAYLQSGNLAASEADYHQLENSSSNIFQIHYGLAEIARQHHDTNLALHYFASCLSHATPGTALWETARKYRDELSHPAGGVALEK